MHIYMLGSSFILLVTLLMFAVIEEGEGEIQIVCDYSSTCCSSWHLYQQVVEIDKCVLLLTVFYLSYVYLLILFGLLSFII
jgi:hypothetical protein